MMLSQSYLSLGEAFYQRSQPQTFSSPQLLLWNQALTSHLSMNDLPVYDEKSLAEIFSGQKLLSGSEPIALAYAGHQFGHFNPQLGDGRAHLLGQFEDDKAQLWDLQLKGSGRSAFSRNGDGLCTLSAAVREYIMSESMAALGIPTTRCLAVVKTGDKVFRQGPEEGAVVTRVASSHLRVGTFEYFAARKNITMLKALVNFAIKRHYPQINPKDDDAVLLLLSAVIEKQIALVVEWMRVGFIHGVMNTDNTLISGETIDYGPCAMMGIYDPNTVFSSIDRQGRYAFANQSSIAHWNMLRFAESLLPLLDDNNSEQMERLADIVNQFDTQYHQAYEQMMAKKMGLAHCQSGDQTLIADFLACLQAQKLDYTDSFIALSQAVDDTHTQQQMRLLLGDVFDQWQQRLALETNDNKTIKQLMQRNNPSFIARNEQVEHTLAACRAGDVEAVKSLLQSLRAPYQQLSAKIILQAPDGSFDQHYHTFCGT